MHAEIEKLLHLAKEKGGITEHQRQLIVSKAKQLGEDMVDVEFFLENIPIINSNKSNTQNAEDNITIESLEGNSNASSHKASLFDINEGNITVANSMVKRLNPLNKNNKGCRKGCLSVILIMVIMGILGFIFNLIIGVF